ncbi:hypothetical protein CSW98_14995 [Vibrio sp. HA2012]|uniref:regulatory protein ToxS n=1 Tax=Vibrio sp. HA2012 TaxID=1971595 RepID=UPI000C2BCCC7|nr:regulatory protein ToxS [Vibrio sp. HA2012]PJC85492.1 hypothetical protein CSW98_14995 [Vibrio sp. HA2012]
MLNKRIAYFLLAVSVLFSSWIYWGTDLKTKQTLTSREWYTNTVFIASREAGKAMPELSEISKIHGRDTLKFLPNGSYIKASVMNFYDQKHEMFMEMELSESGQWELSDNYLLVHPDNVVDTTPNKAGRSFSDEQMGVIKELYMLDAQESKRIDIINNTSILLTSLDHGSIILSSN